MMFKPLGLLGLCCVLGITSCVVPLKKLQDEQSKRTACEQELTALKSKSQSLEADQLNMEQAMTILKASLTELTRDTTRCGKDLRVVSRQYAQLNEAHEKLTEKHTKMLESNQNETKKIAAELSSTQTSLLKKQDELRLLGDSLAAKKQYLETLRTTLMEREQKIAEMQAILKKKDEAVQAIKKSVSDALLGFENKGLTISQKNGKVYVSLDENLLFASGKTTVEKKGVEALGQLASVLEKNQDINVMVEGHTDNVPMKGTGEIKDNWDLSVLRATSIVKILTHGNNINPKRLTAAGRGEFFPIDPSNSTDAHRKNRRTEIILSPKLDELFKILDGN